MDERGAGYPSPAILRLTFVTLRRGGPDRDLPGPLRDTEGEGRPLSVTVLPQSHAAFMGGKLDNRKLAVSGTAWSGNQRLRVHRTSPVP